MSKTDIVLLLDGIIRRSVRAILDTSYQNFLGQEFIPSRDPLRSLTQGFRICDV